MNRRFLLLAAFAILSPWSAAFAQITIAPVSKPGDVLVARLEIPVVEGATNVVELSAADGVAFKQFGDDIPVWPKEPGKYWIQALVKTQIHGSKNILVAGPTWPENKDDIKQEAFVYLIDKFEKPWRVEFVVEGVKPPEPPPGPDPPGPVPGDFAGKARAWLKAVPPAAYSKEKALAVADNYLTIGSQGGDPARSGGWTAATFGDLMKPLNVDVLGADGVGAWREPFFRPLANHQAALITQRNISASDIKAIAALWTETGEAIKAAAY